MLKGIEKKLIAVGLLVGLIIIGVIGGWVYLTIPPSGEKMYYTYLELEEYQKGYGDVYLKQFDGSRFFWGKLDQKRVEESQEYTKNLVKTWEETGAFVDIESVKLSTKDYSQNYYWVDIKVKNNGNSSIKYILIDLYFKDKDGNVVMSDWTNDNAIILPGATQVVSKMTPKDNNWDTVQAVIREVKY